MNLRQIKRQHDAATAKMLAAHRAAQAWLDEQWDDWDGDDTPRDLTCRACSGAGGDPWNDGITPCEACDGEGYEWWQ